MHIRIDQWSMACLLASFLFVSPVRAAGSFVGAFSGLWDGEPVTLRLDSAEGDTLTGTLQSEFDLVDVVARIQGDGLRGVLSVAGASEGFEARLDSDRLILAFDSGEVLQLRRGDGVSAASPREANEAPLPPSLRVVINGKALSAEELSALVQQYQIPIVAGDYWYDPVCGAWGYQGGPMVGVIRAGLPFGGALAADASNGDTGVFVNGRQLAMQDLYGLATLLGQVPRGRYAVDAAFNFGAENGPALVNLVALSQQLQAQQSGGSSWTSPGGAAGGTDGQGGGYVWIPGSGGGIGTTVSY